MGARMLAIAAILLGLLPCAAAAQTANDKQGKLPVSQQVISELAPTGVLRAGINMSNFLLVSSKDASGGPVGVAPDMAGEIANAARRAGQATCPTRRRASWPTRRTTDAWDIGLIGAEPQRAEKIAFSAGLLRDRGDLSGAGRIAPQVACRRRSGRRAHLRVGRAAYGLWLERNIKQAELVRTDSLDSSYRASSCATSSRPWRACGRG